MASRRPLAVLNIGSGRPRSPVWQTPAYRPTLDPYRPSRPRPNVAQPRQIAGHGSSPTMALGDSGGNGRRCRQTFLREKDAMFPASHGRGGAAGVRSGAGPSGHGTPSRPDPTRTYKRKCQNRPISRSAPPAEKPDSANKLCPSPRLVPLASVRIVPGRNPAAPKSASLTPCRHRQP